MLNFVPENYIYKFAQRGNLKLKIVGIFEHHFEDFCKINNWQFKYNVRTPIWSGNSKSVHKRESKNGPKKFNIERPKLYKMVIDGRDTLVMVVMPGKDYVLHYSQMVIEYLDLIKRSSRADTYSIERKKDWEVLYFPECFNKLGNWSDFQRVNIQNGDIVIMGYVEQFAEYFDTLVDFYKSNDTQLQKEECLGQEYLK